MNSVVLTNTVLLTHLSICTMGWTSQKKKSMGMFWGFIVSNFMSY